MGQIVPRGPGRHQRRALLRSDCAESCAVDRTPPGAPAAGRVQLALSSGASRVRSATRAALRAVPAPQSAGHRASDRADQARSFRVTGRRAGPGCQPALSWHARDEGAESDGPVARRTQNSALQVNPQNIKIRYSSLKFASLMSLPQRAVSLAMNAPNCSGVLETVSTASSPRRCLTFALARALTRSALTLSTIGRGVPAGNRMPHQFTAAKPLSPASASVGNSGVKRQRSSLVTASARILPVFKPCIAGTASENIVVIWPPARSVIASALPL